MKATIAIISLVCVMVSAHASFVPNNQRGKWSPIGDRRPSPTFPRPPRDPVYRFRREAHPQDHGSINLEVMKPIDGSGRPPTIDLNYNHHLLNDDRGHFDAYGGAHYDMHHMRPHAGFELERNYDNGFIRGRGEVQPGYRGGLEPRVMFDSGFRFG